MKILYGKWNVADVMVRLHSISPWGRKILNVQIMNQGWNIDERKKNGFPDLWNKIIKKNREWDNVKRGSRKLQNGTLKRFRHEILIRVEKIILAHKILYAGVTLNLVGFSLWYGVNYYMYFNHIITTRSDNVKLRSGKGGCV